MIKFAVFNKTKTAQKHERKVNENDTMGKLNVNALGKVAACFKCVVARITTLGQRALKKVLDNTLVLFYLLCDVCCVIYSSFCTLVHLKRVLVADLFSL